jgi:phosphatidylserine/phosphatidylglycerophosphate/cardiolipin synthase-like enzyme
MACISFNRGMFLPSVTIAMVHRAQKDGVSVRAIIGSRAILLAMDADAAARRGLLGFAIGRRQPSGQIRWLRGFKFFEETVPNPQPGERRSTFEHPIQTFLWGDYTVTPESKTTYVVQPVRGRPAALEHGTPVELEADAASEDSGDQSVLFNRGAIPSQAFADRFGNQGPTDQERDDPDNDKVRWLSRGLLKGALDFVAQATGPAFELRVAAYEFYYAPILDALRAAAGRGAKVQISFDGGDQKRDGTITPSSISTENLAAIAGAGLDTAPNVSLHPRTLYSSIPHNKFIVLLENGAPRQVWTGSTNFTASGFLGQSNVGHLVRLASVAQKYNEYWEALCTDPGTRSFKQRIGTMSPPPPAAGLADGMTTIFSPRKAGMMEWYAERFGAAQSSVMFTAAFGVAPQIAEKFAEDRDYLRFILMERKDTNAEEQAMVESDRDTIIALGSHLNSDTIHLKIDGHALDEWFKEEEHFRKKGHIFYIHTKYMLLDPLGNAPLIFTGSANFSDNSVERNDENMLLLGGAPAKSVAETYVTEFHRLFNHLYFRTIAVRVARSRRAGGRPRPVAFLDPTDSWVAGHFKPGTYRNKRRLLFR